MTSWSFSCPLACPRICGPSRLSLTSSGVITRELLEETEWERVYPRFGVLSCEGRYDDDDDPWPSATRDERGSAEVLTDLLKSLVLEPAWKLGFGWPVTRERCRFVGWFVATDSRVCFRRLEGGAKWERFGLSWLRTGLRLECSLMGFASSLALELEARTS